MINDKSKTSIEQLYKNRKQQYKMPDSLRESLKANARKNTRRQYWRYALPFAFASVLTVVFVWPNKTVLFAPQLAFNSEKRVASESILEAELPSQALSQSGELLIQRAEPVEDVAEDMFLNGAADIAVLSEKSIKKQTAKPAAKLESKSKSVVSNTQIQSPVVSLTAASAEPELKDELAIETIDSLALDMLADAEYALEESISEATEAAPTSSGIVSMKKSNEQKADTKERVFSSVEQNKTQLDVGESRTFKVVDGEKGLFEDCEGKEIELPVKTDFLNWVIIIFDQEHQYSVEKLDQEKCDIEY